MVDYNSQQTISTPPGDVLKIAILERRHYVLEAYKEYKKAKVRGNDPQVDVFKAGLYALFLEIEPSLQDSMDDKEFEKLKKVVQDETDEDVNGDSLKAFEYINRWLYSKNLTKFDTRKSVDHTDIEAVNKQNGF